MFEVFLKTGAMLSYDHICKLRSGRRPLEISFHLILAVPPFSDGKFHQLLLGDHDLQLIHEHLLYMCVYVCVGESYG